MTGSQLFTTTVSMLCFFLFTLGAIAEPAEEKVVARLLSATTNAPYSYYGFSYPSPPDRKLLGFTEDLMHFARGTKVGDLVDAEGNVILFRNIGQPYARGFIDSGEAYIAKEGKAYSYSLSPSIINSWASPENPDSYTLIAIQNLDRDGLRTKTQKAVAPGEIITEQPPLTRNFVIEDIAYYQEVKVPVEKENVVAVVKQSEFKRALAKFGSKPFHLNEFLTALALESSFSALERLSGSGSRKNYSPALAQSCEETYKAIGRPKHAP